MRFPKLLRLCASVLALLSLAACASLYANSAPTPQSTAAELGEASTPQPTTASGATVLTVWLPPQFDAAGGDLAATILQDRLAQFSEQNPQVRVETRVKAESGPGGLMDALLNAQTAAPLALPDLVLLPNSLLPLVAEAGVIHAQDRFADALEDDDWYPFGQQMAVAEGGTYGLPFATDALVVAHRTTAISQVPSSWNSLLNTRIALGFAAGDENATMTIAELLSLREAEATGFAPSEDDLSAVFDLYANGQARQVFPFWLTQYQTQDQTWQALTEGQFPMASAWSQRVFSNRLSEISGALMPTMNGRPFALVRGWVWAVTAPNAENATLAAELAEFLVSPEFLAQYSAAASLLPPRASSLAAWTPGPNQALANQIVVNAVPVPDQTTLDTWGPALQAAVIGLLKQELSPAEAVQSVLAAVSSSQ
jgi:ABC-type glycerol-3-phosphate transport system substrate-binding protein